MTSRNLIYGQTNPLFPELQSRFKTADRIDIIVSFVMKGGVRLLSAEIGAAVRRGVPVRVLTSTYMDVSDPTALAMLKELVGERGEVRLYNGPAGSFHPKAYIFHAGDGGCVYVGSSNVSNSALTDGVEWNYRILRETDPEAFAAFTGRFDHLYREESMELSDQVLKEYRDNYVERERSGSRTNAHYRKYKRPAVVYPEGVPSWDQAADGMWSPNDPQLEALIELRKTRMEGSGKALVVAATGLGKTFLAAFDYKQFREEKGEGRTKGILFLAHREEILNQAHETFGKVLGLEGMGKLYDGQEPEEGNPSRVLFASIQTMARQGRLERFGSGDFAYIVVDEFHHAAADSYRRILEHFRPEFLLGITATPFRNDQKDIHGLYDYNLVYEADLFTAINRDWLCPFSYYGIHDYTVNYDNITWLGGKYVEKELEAGLNIGKRHALVFEHFQKWRGHKGLGFCVSIRHADGLAAYFNSRGVKAAAVHSGQGGPFVLDRKAAVEGLKNGEVEVIFSVDIFNEGVDIPELDLLLFLRPTESPVVFLQQLGRGLRKAEGKERVRILDFIGNFKKVSMIPFLLGRKRPGGSRRVLDTIRKELEEDGFLPADCRVEFEFQVVDLLDRMLTQKVKVRDQIRESFDVLAEELGRTPSRMEFYESMDTEFYRSVKATRMNPFRDYIGFAGNPGISPEGIRFIRMLEQTNMSQLYKLPVFLAFHNQGDFRREVGPEELIASFREFYQDPQNARDLLRNKSGRDFRSWGDDRYGKLAYDNPVHFLTKTHSDIFVLEGKRMRIRVEMEEDLGNPVFTDQVLDVIRFRRSDFLNTRVEKWEGNEI
ncbi:DEAD/DEAH box helicase family protein [Anaerotalea alkaliphila]|uniref:DEAD/DEAH box helicase family protein n=1 Tax=Anaerotalea alkaliphila TaxID=2662126 RepID=A0A7X5HW43_9FIRM|nr:DEAD/DEAH box helicase family protein [Anaerotalea alkaliphila]NDL67541.1 DEAD/DEAH box helicase family protein [Anaerotalea alkaliphila]